MSGVYCCLRGMFTDIVYNSTGPLELDLHIFLSISFHPAYLLLTNYMEAKEVQVLPGKSNRRDTCRFHECGGASWPRSTMWKGHFKPIR